MTRRDTAWAQSLIARIKAADEALDVEAFVALLADNVRFRLGSAPAVTGKPAVAAGVRDLFATLAGLHHQVGRVLVDGDTLVFEAEVTYRTRAGATITLPYVDVLTVGEDDLVGDYRIYIDLGPLFA